MPRSITQFMLSDANGRFLIVRLHGSGAIDLDIEADTALGRAQLGYIKLPPAAAEDFRQKLLGSQIDPAAV